MKTDQGSESQLNIVMYRYMVDQHINNLTDTIHLFSPALGFMDHVRHYVEV